MLAAAVMLAVVGAGILVAEEAPASKPALAATVGSAEITTGRIDQIFSKQTVPPDAKPEDIKRFKQMLLSRLVGSELLHAYLEANKVVCPPEDVDKIKKEVEKAAVARKMSMEDLMAAAGLTMSGLEDAAKQQKLMAAATSDAQADAYIKTHPAYFNGTKVQASHILIACSPLGSTEEQKAAIKKLEGIAEDIKSNKVTFAAAATLHSSCPSKAKGGDLGEFGFESMVPPFAKAAFDTPVGSLTGVVRTQFGFHLIKVTEKKEGKDTPGADARTVAKNAIQSDIENQVFDQALTSCPIVIHAMP